MSGSCRELPDSCRALAAVLSTSCAAVGVGTGLLCCCRGRYRFDLTPTLQGELLHLGPRGPIRLLPMDSHRFPFRSAVRLLGFWVRGPRFVMVRVLIEAEPFSYTQEVIALPALARNLSL